MSRPARRWRILHASPSLARYSVASTATYCRTIPPGENYLHYTAERGHPEPLFKWRSRYWSFLLKLDPNRPSPTIQAQPGPNVGPFHWENRRLRVGEIKRLFTFPDEFELVGSRASIQAQLGNAVPPLLAEKVAAKVISTVDFSLTPAPDQRPGS